MARRAVQVDQVSIPGRFYAEPVLVTPAIGRGESIPRPGTAVSLAQSRREMQLVIKLDVAWIALERRELRMLLVESRHSREAKLVVGAGQRALDVLLEVFVTGGALPILHASQSGLSALVLLMAGSAGCDFRRPLVGVVLDGHKLADMAIAAFRVDCPAPLCARVCDALMPEGVVLNGTIERPGRMTSPAVGLKTGVRRGDRPVRSELSAAGHS